MSGLSSPNVPLCSYASAVVMLVPPKTCPGHGDHLPQHVCMALVYSVLIHGVMALYLPVRSPNHLIDHDTLLWGYSKTDLDTIGIHPSVDPQMSCHSSPNVPLCSYAPAVVMLVPTKTHPGHGLGTIYHNMWID